MDKPTNDTFHCPLDGTYDLRDNPGRAIQMLYTESDLFLLKVLIPIVSSFGFAGNVAFLFSVIRVAEMRSTLAVYLVNLAFADMMFLAAVNYFYAIEGPINKAYYVNSYIGCALVSMAYYPGYFGSLFLITLISVERYFAVCKPFKAIMLKGTKRNVKILSAIWILSFVFGATLIVHYGKFKQYCMLWPDDEQFHGLPEIISRCHTLNEVSDQYNNAMSFVTFFVMMAINGVFYVRIIYALSHRGIVGNNVAATRARNQVARTLVINGLLFFCCHLPFRVYSFVDFFGNFGYQFLDGYQKSILLPVATMLLIVNSIINPFVYILTCAHYRNCMMKAFGLVCNKRNMIWTQRYNATAE